MLLSSLINSVCKNEEERKKGIILPEYSTYIMTSWDIVKA